MSSEKHKTTDAALRKLVECEWFEWVPGMWVRGKHGRGRIVDATDASVELVYESDHGISYGWADAAVCLPIPSDPATAGCLLEMYLHRGGAFLGLEALAAARPMPEEYASFGDFLVAELLNGETS